MTAGGCDLEWRTPLGASHSNRKTPKIANKPARASVRILESQQLVFRR
jgi:hypothetical protein